jgi:hypothetical protein
MTGPVTSCGGEEGATFCFVGDELDEDAKESWDDWERREGRERSVEEKAWLRVGLADLQYARPKWMALR